MAPSPHAPNGAVGAYGLRLENVERARRLLLPAAAEWPRLRIRRKVGLSDAEVEWMTEREATLKLHNGGEIAVNRARGEAVFLLPHRVGTGELVHPLLAPVAAVMAYWLDRESFHASAFVAGDKAWGVVGERGSGKSTTVARLALDGIGIVCDDMLILEALDAFAAPRSVDLRAGAARRLGAGEPLGVVGARERWRLTIGAVPPRLRLAGWIFLGWGERVESVPLKGSERFTRLHNNRGAQLPPRNVDVLLELASLPGWELRRPRQWSSLSDAVDCLLQTVG
jgi:hypothetical protein